MSFVVGIYQAVEHPGGGHRASAAGLWRGEDLRSLNEVAMTVLPADCADAAKLAVESVAALRHPHLLPVIDLCQDEDRVTIVCPWPSGGRLAELVVRRGRLTVGETLTVLIPLAGVLAAAHAAGIRHGGVCPESVWFDGDGRPLLGAPAVSRLIAELNDGLPAGSRDVAPEVIRGEKLPGGAITLAADVFSLGSVALFCLTGRSAWPADDPADVLIQSAAGLWPDLPDDAGPSAVVALVREMLQDEPVRRPSAASLAARLTKAGEPAAITFSSGPAPAPASADRWRGWSRTAAGVVSGSSGAGGRHAQDAAPDAAGPDALPAGQATVGPAGGDEAGGDEAGGDQTGGEETGDVAEQAPTATTARRRERPARERNAGPGRTPSRRRPAHAWVGIALLVSLLVTVVGVQVGVWWTGWEQTDAPTVVGPEAVAGPVAVGDAAGDPSWSDVVTGLDAARGRAMDAADPALLSEVYLNSASGPGAADAAVIEQLARSGLRVVDGVHQVVSVTVDDPAPGGPTPDSVAPAGVTVGAVPSTAGIPGDGSVRLAVVDTLPAHPIVDAAGRQVGLTPARAEQRRILVLSRTDRGYRISSVEPG